MRLIRRARPLRKRDRIVIRYEFASPREHMRNKERHSSVGVESRLAGAGLSPSTTSALRSMRHGRRAGELEGLFAFITRLLPDCLVPGDERDREGPLQPAQQKDRQPHPLFEGGRRDRRGGRQRGHQRGTKSRKAATSKSPTRTLRPSLSNQRGPSTSTSSSRVRRSTTSTTSGPISLPLRVRSELTRSSPSGRQ